MLRLSEFAVLASADEILAGWPEVALALSQQEWARVGALRRAVDQDAFAAAHTLARMCAAELAGGRPQALTLQQRCAQCLGPHGRPSIVQLPEVHIALAHSHGWVAAVASPAPCGIDVERLPPGADASRLPIARALAPAELRWLGEQVDPALAFRRLWVRKEALIKAGLGSIDDLPALDVADPSAPDGLAAQVAGFAVHGGEFEDVEAQDGSRLAAAVALRAA